MDRVKAISYFLNFSPIQADYLQNSVKKYEQGRTKWKLIDVCHTLWIGRIDGLDVFEELFTYIVKTLECFSVNPESTINKDASIKALSFTESYLKFQFYCLSSHQKKDF